ncbi:MAG TPA: YhjD/YihY/BrkB family envelope integrity protein, partial [Actinomycetota bacterium]|nr:YhjD/YihY/BrkB family envelope integrity protein [Actinomycetota bacterium]
AVAAPADRVLAWDRILAWAGRRPERVFGYNPWQLGAHVLHTALRHRVTGPAAEMSFFAMLTLVPLTVAVGAALGQIQRFVGPEKIARGQDAAISLVRVVISPRLTDGVVDPFVRAQLSQQKGGAALGGLLLTWWLAGRLFAATSRALDTAYEERHQRLSVHQRLIALGFAFGSVVVVVLTLGIMVDAPFLDEQRNLAAQFGVSQALVTVWYVLRWPVVLLVLVVFLLCLYRFAPSVRHAWRHLVPGAVLGVLLWILAAVAFRIYLALGSGAPTGVVVNDARVVIIGQAVGAVVATVLWTYFSSVAILVGNELNAELARLRAESV